MEEIKSKVIKIISEKLGKDVNDVKIDAHLVTDLGLDSLDTVEVIMEFEKEFNISIPDEEAEKISNVNDAVSYIEKKLAKK
jgi:acyl carrier protein